MNIFTYGATEMMGFPMDIYPNLIRNFFTYILPAIFLLYYPALYILDKPDPLGMPSLLSLLGAICSTGGVCGFTMVLELRAAFLPEHRFMT